MKNTILILSGLLILGACAPQNLARLSGGAPQEEISSGNFEYIGCHKISAGDDRWAMGLLGLQIYLILIENASKRKIHDLQSAPAYQAGPPMMG